RMVLLRDAGGHASDMDPLLAGETYGFLAQGATPGFRYFDPENPREAALGRFQDRYLDTASPRTPTTKWAPVVLDFDDDGVEDVYLPEANVGMSMYPEAVRQGPLLLHGTGRRLVDVTRDAGL